MQELSAYDSDGALHQRCSRNQGERSSDSDDSAKQITGYQKQQFYDPPDRFIFCVCQFSNREQKRVIGITSGIRRNRKGTAQYIKEFSDQQKQDGRQPPCNRLGKEKTDGIDAGTRKECCKECDDADLLLINKICKRDHQQINDQIQAANGKSNISLQADKKNRKWICSKRGMVTETDADAENQTACGCNAHALCTFLFCHT